MSSLLQFKGKIGKKGVQLQFVIEDPKFQWPRPEHYPDRFLCSECGETHPYIWVAWRYPAGMFGS